MGGRWLRSPDLSILIIGELDINRLIVLAINWQRQFHVQEI